MRAKRRFGPRVEQLESRLMLSRGGMLGIVAEPPADHSPPAEFATFEQKSLTPADGTETSLIQQTESDQQAEAPLADEGAEPRFELDVAGPTEDSNAGVELQQEPSAVLDSRDQSSSSGPTADQPIESHASEPIPADETQARSHEQTTDPSASDSYVPVEPTQSNETQSRDVLILSGGSTDESDPIDSEPRDVDTEPRAEDEPVENDESEQCDDALDPDRTQTDQGEEDCNQHTNDGAEDDAASAVAAIPAGCIAATNQTVQDGAGRGAATTTSGELLALLIPHTPDGSNGEQTVYAATAGGSESATANAGTSEEGLRQSSSSAEEPVAQIGRWVDIAAASLFALTLSKPFNETKAGSSSKFPRPGPGDSPGSGRCGPISRRRRHGSWLPGFPFCNDDDFGSCKHAVDQRAQQENVANDRIDDNDRIDAAFADAAVLTLLSLPEAQRDRTDESDAGRASSQPTALAGALATGVLTAAGTCATLARSQRSRSSERRPLAPTPLYTGPTLVQTG